MIRSAILCLLLAPSVAAAECHDVPDSPVAPIAAAVAAAGGIHTGHFRWVPGTPVVEDQGYEGSKGERLWLDLPDGRSLALESDFDTRNEIFQFVPGTDVRAFDGRTVTVRARLDTTGKVLRVTEFAPGESADFLSGRVGVDGTRVFVRTQGRGEIAIADPALAAELARHPNLGVILPGKVDGTTFAGAPERYWMLVLFPQLPAPVPGTDRVEGEIEAATSRTSVKARIPAALAGNVKVHHRMYVLGRFVQDGAGERIDATDVSTSAGSPWTVATSVPAS